MVLREKETDNLDGNKDNRQRQKDSRQEMKDNRKAHYRRKADTARKVRLGTMLINKAKAGDRKAKKLIYQYIAQMSLQDRKAFEDWDIFQD